MNLLAVNARRTAQIALSSALFWAGATGFANAEVCDKERPNWTPGEHVSWLSEAISIALLPPSLICMAFACFAAILPPRKIYVLASVPLVLLSVAIAYDRWAPDDMIHPGIREMQQSAIREGCIGEPYLTLALFMIIAALPFRAFWSKTT